MKKLKRLIAVILVCILFIGCGKFFRYLLVNDTTSYTRIMMHELYHQEENIDILFVGSSHCYRSFVPEITDAYFQKNTFNCGTSSQYLDGSLALIKEAAQSNDIEQIYLEVYYNVALSEPYKERELLTSTYIISDYMKPSLRKVEYLLEASSSDHYVNSFIVARRSWEKLFDADYVVALLKRKGSEAYKNYEYDYVTTENEYYVGKGYVANVISVEDGTYWNAEDFDEIKMENINEDWKNSLYEIIDYCDKHGIQLTLVSAPMPDFRLVNVGNYDDYIALIREMLEGTDIEYYDFNLMREEYFPNDTSYFKDSDHLNDKGAVLFSTIFSQFMTGALTEEELFYASYEEKINALDDDIFGLIVNEDKDSHTVTIEPVTNADIANISYHVIVKPDQGETKELTGTEPLGLIAYQEGESGKIEIFAYLNGKEENHITVAYGVEE